MSYYYNDMKKHTQPAALNTQHIHYIIIQIQNLANNIFKSAQIPDFVFDFKILTKKDKPHLKLTQSSQYTHT